MKELALRMGGPLAAATVVVAGMLTMAPSAQATPADCETFLRSHHYVVGKMVKVSCKAAESGTGLSKTVCKVKLKELGVKSRDADTACGLSSR
ncbi:hypothetical protein [Streptomyces buecherae]|uniref:Secreted protein n=1 Tax=Streptomyces buecherae TaxID=2763006 RepID=A0A7H8NBI2_9ACTN|nr:hypothetical protein [Streptomyces buecherae]QKW51869.1 hypothetical protein HUT08_22655 [Streptomyces buecherae]